MSLINSNSEHSVQAVTEKAFFLCIGQTGSIEKVKQSITALTELKGVGPATASLILSVYDPVEVPFFADELFLYCTNQGLFTSQAPEKKYKIKYTMKEYQELLLQTQKTRSRIDTEAQGLGKASALDLEMTAYVLAHAPQLIKDEGGNQARSSGTMEIGESEEEASSATAADTGGKRDVADDQAEEVEDKPPAKRRRTSGRHKSDQPEPQKHEKSRRLRQRQMEH